MVFGIMSPIVLVTLVPAVITSLLAILFGHFAQLKISQSGGRLLGRGQAIAGLVTGYLFLPISLYLAPGFFRYPETIERSPAKQLLMNAERSIKNSTRSTVRGNSSKAKQLAQEVSSSLSQLGALAFVKSDDSGTETMGFEKFNVYCHLAPDSVCFLVNIPNYHKYETEAKELLSTLAWRSGRGVIVAEKLEGRMEMGVGLKGRFLYGDVMVGPASNEKPSESNLTRRRLERFFE